MGRNSKVSAYEMEESFSPRSARSNSLSRRSASFILKQEQSRTQFGFINMNIDNVKDQEKVNCVFSEFESELILGGIKGRSLQTIKGRSINSVKNRSARKDFPTLMINNEKSMV